MFQYNDPIADFIGTDYATPRPQVFRPLPRPPIALVQPAPADKEDDDHDGFDPPMPEEPEHIRAWFVDMRDMPADVANDDEHKDAAPAAVPMKPLKKAPKTYKPLKVAHPTSLRSPTATRNTPSGSR